MKLNCEVIEDLLPLYTDGGCSEGSRQLIQAHIKACSTCERCLK